jgi:hypothetical protein
VSDDDPAPSPRNPLVAVVLAITAAVALLFACFSTRWLANVGPDGSIEMGLRSTTECGSVGMLLGPEPGQCRTKGNADYAKEWDTPSASYYSAAFAPCGWISLVACLIAALGLAGAAGLGLAKKKPHLPVSPSTLGLLGIMAALITGCVFVATKPGPPGFVGVGITFWIFGIGAVLGIASSIMLAKINRPLDPDLMDDAMHPDQF